MKSIVSLFVIVLGAGLAGTPAAWAQAPGDTLQDVRPFGTHALDRLVGREAGVEVISSPGAPGMTPTVHIRGFGVIPGIEPVYIVDGMRRRNLDDLAPESIEKIEVLKDASAMGLYGPDAAAGVVVVTTKRATEKGFHAGYDFTGGFQSLAHEPAPLPLAEWAAFWGDSADLYREPDLPAPETAFLQSHHLYARYGGNKLSAGADFSLLDNDGPYAGRTDTHRRYAASWSAAYRPLSWLSLETTGRWSRSAVSGAPKSWLKDYIVSSPEYIPEKTFEKWYKGQWEQAETVIQGKLEVRPLPGLFLRGTAGYSHGLRSQYEASWVKDLTVDAEAGTKEATWLQWGAEAGWSGLWRGHRLRLDATFRHLREKQENLILGGEDSYADLGLAFGEDGEVEAKYLRPQYDLYTSHGGGQEGWMAMTSKLKTLDSSSPQLEWNETVLSAAYDWKDRYRMKVSCFLAWEDKLSFQENTVIPAVTLGWTPSSEPLLRRMLPDWWQDLLMEASWSRTRNYYPFLQQNLIYGTFPNFTYSYSLDARHRDLKVSSSFQAGDMTLDLTGGWFINDDGLSCHPTAWSVLPVTASSPVRAEEGFLALRNEGVELAASLRGSIGAFRYGLDGYLTFYRNRVSMGECLLGIPFDPIDHLVWANSRVEVKDGEPVGGMMYWDRVVHEDGRVTTGESHWAGNAFPALTGGLRASLGWNRWQLTVSGHGDAGQTILHVDYLDALYRYYMEHSPKTISWARSENCILSASFFRLDQVRLDYTLPLRGSILLNLFASLENGLLLTKYPGSDPELALAWNGLGVETATYPSTRRMLFGVKVGF